MKLLLNELIESQPIVAQLEDTIETVLKKMGSYNTIPVIDSMGNYKGVINKVKIYQMLLENKETYIYKADKLVDNYQPICKKDSLETVLLKLENAKYLFLPLVEDNKFIGIITNKKILKLFNNFIATNEEGKNITLVTYDYEGALHKVTKILKDEKINLLSISVFNPKVMNLKELILKVEVSEDNLNKLIDKFKSKGLKIKD